MRPRLYADACFAGYDFSCKAIIISSGFTLRLNQDWQIAVSVLPQLKELLTYICLDFFYPIALVYLVFALRRVYQQKWAMTVLKAVVLFACETLLFFAVNIGGFVIAYTFV